VSAQTSRLAQLLASPPGGRLLRLLRSASFGPLRAPSRAQSSSSGGGGGGGPGPAKNATNSSALNELYMRALEPRPPAHVPVSAAERAAGRRAHAAYAQGLWRRHRAQMKDLQRKLALKWSAVHALPSRALQLEALFVDPYVPLDLRLATDTPPLLGFPGGQLAEEGGAAAAAKDAAGAAAASVSAARAAEAAAAAKRRAALGHGGGGGGGSGSSSGAAAAPPSAAALKPRPAAAAKDDFGAESWDDTALIAEAAAAAAKAAPPPKAAAPAAAGAAKKKGKK